MNVCRHACVPSCFSRVPLFVTLCTVACQAPLSMGFSRQEYWSRLPCPPGTLPWVVGIFKPMSLVSPSLNSKLEFDSHEGKGLNVASMESQSLKCSSFFALMQHAVGGVPRALQVLGDPLPLQHAPSHFQKGCRCSQVVSLCPPAQTI